MENKQYNISKCCNSHVTSIPMTLLELMSGGKRDYICTGCRNFCEVELKPAYLKKANGIYSSIVYNDKKYK